MTNVIHICSMGHRLGEKPMNVIIKVMNIIKQKSYSAVIYYITQVTRYRMVYTNPGGRGREGLK